MFDSEMGFDAELIAYLLDLDYGEPKRASEEEGLARAALTWESLRIDDWPESGRKDSLAGSWAMVFESSRSF